MPLTDQNENSKIYDFASGKLQSELEKVEFKIAICADFEVDPASLVFYNAPGSHLEHEGIEPGDVLVCTKDFDEEKVTAEKIAVVEVSQGVIARRVGIDKDSIYITTRKGRKLEIKPISRDRAKIVALMLGIYRPYLILIVKIAILAKILMV